MTNKLTYDIMSVSENEKSLTQTNKTKLKKEILKMSIYKVRFENGCDEERVTSYIGARSAYGALKTVGTMLIGDMFILEKDTIDIFNSKTEFMESFIGVRDGNTIIMGNSEGHIFELAADVELVTLEDVPTRYPIYYYKGEWDVWSLMQVFVYFMQRELKGERYEYKPELTDIEAYLRFYKNPEKEESDIISIRKDWLTLCKVNDLI